MFGNENTFFGLMASSATEGIGKENGSTARRMIKKRAIMNTLN